MSITYGAALGAPVSDTDGASSIDFVTDVALGVDDTALLGVTYFGNQTPSITDWTLDNVAQVAGTPNFRCARFSRAGALPSGSTVSVTFGGSVDVVNVFGEYVTSDDPLEVDSVADGEGGTSAWAVDVTTSDAAFCVASTWVDFATNPNTPAAGCSESNDFDGGGYRCATVYRNEPSAGTYTLGGNTVNGITHVVAAVAYKEAAITPSDPPQPNCYKMTAGGLVPIVARRMTASGLFPPVGP